MESVWVPVLAMESVWVPVLAMESVPESASVSVVAVSL
jgi:hypothetical protein